jgi:hypothetical protein
MPVLAESAAGEDRAAMFMVDEAAADAIRRAFVEDGEFAAAVELRRHFPGIVDNANARLCARAIASWEPRTIPAGKPRRRRPKMQQAPRAEI